MKLSGCQRGSPIPMPRDVGGETEDLHSDEGADHNVDENEQ